MFISLYFVYNIFNIFIDVQRAIKQGAFRVFILQNIISWIFLLGPRTRRPKKPPGDGGSADEKRPRTAFSGPQLARLKVYIKI